MSYILDALKKSDQERKQGEIPSLQTVHTDPLSAKSKRSTAHRKMFFTLIPCCLALLILVLWQWPIQPAPQTTGQPAAKAQIAPIAGQEQLPPQPPPAQKPTPRTTQPAQQDVPRSDESVQAEPPLEPQGTAGTPVIQPEVVIEPAPLSQPEHPQPPPPPKGAGEPESTLPLLKDLPVDRQQALPEIKLAGHVYADEPSRRMIMINNRIVREGEMIGDNLRLVRISWDGVVLRHLDTEFRMKLQ